MGKSKREKREVSTARPRESATGRRPRATCRAESLRWALPLDRLGFEIEATDGILGLPHETEARTPRALWWGTLQVFGDDDGEAFNSIFACAARRVRKDEWRALWAAAPITANETLIGRAVAFVAAARALLVDEPLDERLEFLRALTQAAMTLRPMTLDLIEYARKGLDGMAVRDIDENWVRIEDPETTAALKRVLARNRNSPRSAFSSAYLLPRSRPGRPA